MARINGERMSISEDGIHETMKALDDPLFRKISLSVTEMGTESCPGRMALEYLAILIQDKLNG